MRHRKKSEKFSRNYAQRRALMKALLRSLIVQERIVTTESKAKHIRGRADRLITWAKKDTLHCRRLAFNILGDHNLVKRLFQQIGPRFKEVSGGYTRIIGLGYRKGDGGKLTLVELTKIEKKEKKQRGKKEQKKISKEEKREEKREEKIVSKKEKPKKGIISGMRRIFKKKGDSL
ncbi:MAG: 50S ribosomal protein L17 [Candidatus Omnitrophica bacterium]|nr:50S ribosomal protein L17 [Candidatus Omnitrophota bacterium]MBU0897169.1 50S ribosomal protein L17 [Candidatus Omnitrophota bacterium]MBU1133362.1 50S ribosomal protein L17 [Candidatus Omnitrophota bacterium]MBU1367285.1 50S ribosomal protein L17 [Candidatus Omnitrophota bacterium]MBU1523273.1 50S ribosomal protein L17 [Candidatus Omnitrophota bacterium]